MKDYKWKLEPCRYGLTARRVRMAYLMGVNKCHVFVATRAAKTAAARSLRCLACLNAASNREQVLEREVAGMQMKKSPLTGHLPKCQPYSVDRYCLTKGSGNRHLALYRTDKITESLLCYKMPDLQCLLFKKRRDARSNHELAVCYACELLNARRPLLTKELPVRGMIRSGNMLAFNPSINHVIGCEPISIKDIRDGIPAKISGQTIEKAISTGPATSTKQINEAIVDSMDNTNRAAYASQLRRLAGSNGSGSPEMGIASVDGDGPSPELLYGRAIYVKREVVDDVVSTTNQSDVLDGAVSSPFYSNGHWNGTYQATSVLNRSCLDLRSLYNQSDEGINAGTSRGNDVVSVPLKKHIKEEAVVDGLDNTNMTAVDGQLRRLAESSGSFSPELGIASMDRAYPEILYARVMHVKREVVDDVVNTTNHCRLFDDDIGGRVSSYVNCNGVNQSTSEMKRSYLELRYFDTQTVVGSNAEASGRNYVASDDGPGLTQPVYPSPWSQTVLGQPKEISKVQHLYEHSAAPKSFENIGSKPLSQPIRRGRTSAAVTSNVAGSQLRTGFNDYKVFDSRNKISAPEDVFINDGAERKVHESVVHKGISDANVVSSQHKHLMVTRSMDKRHVLNHQAENVPTWTDGVEFSTKQRNLAVAENELGKPLSVFTMSKGNHDRQKVSSLGSARKRSITDGKPSAKHAASDFEESSNGYLTPSDDTDDEFLACAYVRRIMRRSNNRSSNKFLELERKQQRKQKCEADRRVRYKLRQRVSEGCTSVGVDQSIDPATISLFDLPMVPNRSLTPLVVDQECESAERRRSGEESAQEQPSLSSSEESGLAVRIRRREEFADAQSVEDANNLLNLMEGDVERANQYLAQFDFNFNFDANLVDVKIQEEDIDDAKNAYLAQRAADMAHADLNSASNVDLDQALAELAGNIDADLHSASSVDSDHVIADVTEHVDAELHSASSAALDQFLADLAGDAYDYMADDEYDLFGPVPESC